MSNTTLEKAQSSTSAPDYKTVLARRARKKAFNSSIRYGLLILVGFFMLYPLLWLFGASFKTNTEIFTSIGFIPKHFDFSTYVRAWNPTPEYSFTTFFVNTFLIVIPRVIGAVISCTLTAYGFARFKFKGKGVIFGLLMGTLFLPNVVIYIPQFLLFNSLGWLDTYLPLTVPASLAFDTFFVFMLIQFIRGIPIELEQAAYIDGCNSIQALWYVIVPVLMPAIVSVGLFQFMWSMNDFFGPLLYISSVDKYPVALALRMVMDSSAEIKWNEVIAMNIFSLAPSLILFFAAQKYFVEGVTAGSLKG
jgi:oligogalacturonide transport system permease protein